MLSSPTPANTRAAHQMRMWRVFECTSSMVCLYSLSVYNSSSQNSQHPHHIHHPTQRSVPNPPQHRVPDSYPQCHLITWSHCHPSSTSHAALNNSQSGCAALEGMCYERDLGKMHGTSHDVLQTTPSSGKPRGLSF